jgi:hypothetical protein
MSELEDPDQLDRLLDLDRRLALASDGLAESGVEGGVGSGDTLVPAP